MDYRYLDCDYDSFPFSEKVGRGMKSLDADFYDAYAYTKVRTHVEYRRAGERALHLNIIAPQVDEALPLVMYVQGSAFHKQDIDAAIARLGTVAKRGYVVAIVEHRESDIAPFPAQAMDAKYAVQFLMEHAEEYGIAPGRVVLWGDSSGGHTALMAAFTRGVEGFTAPDLQEYPIAGVVDYYGPVAFYEMRDEPSAINHVTKHSAEGYELGLEEVTPENSKRADVREYIGSAAPPVLIVHGDKDRQVPFGQSCLLNDALLDAGKHVEFYRLHGADHGGAPFWTSQVLDIVDAFIRRCLAR